MNEGTPNILEWLIKIPIPLLLLLIGVVFVLLGLGVKYKTIGITQRKNQKRAVVRKDYVICLSDKELKERCSCIIGHINVMITLLKYMGAVTGIKVKDFEFPQFFY